MRPENINGWRLRQMASAHTHSRRIARTIAWLQSHYAEPLRIEKMARSNMTTTRTLR
jgi:transcriptional regulator GlxA family with amidase domain